MEATENDARFRGDMLLRSLRVHNYRKFEDLTVDFMPAGAESDADGGDGVETSSRRRPGQLAVLVGDNGSGKTAIVDAAVVALGTYLVKFPDVKAPSILKDDVRWSVVTAPDTSTEEFQQRFPVTIEATGDVMGHDHLTWRREKHSERGTTTVSGAKSMVDIGDRDQQKVRETANIHLPLIACYGTDRLWPRDRQKWATHSTAYLQARTRFNGYDGCLDHEVSIKQMSAWFESMTAREYRKKIEIPEFQAVRHTIAESLRLLAGIEDAGIDFDDGRLLVSYTAPDGMRLKDQPFETLSDGYRAVIGMVADIARRMAQLNPFFGKDAIKVTPGVVLIDEVDLHLHPKWQERILDVLTTLFPQIQFIVTTHSPLVISTVRAEELRIIKHDGEGEGTYRAVMPSNETYGSDTSVVLRHVMDAPDRPETVQKLFDRFGDQLDGGDYAGAKATLAKLAQEIDADSPDLSKARSKYFFYSDDVSD
ncbi:AAA family ATPase [Bifidobacterium saguinibicoloris]|uniref:AAA family ATPase n=1 Tax=Bifidobacterium saguinibicoloris TaxID=2834433 RepID=UPI001C55FEA0|nr:AAA family ATPase [Bifidobacterium saguinibicoloris]MBW3081724.1 AAA family ATPase [Bifidobacterium saguinibicoloris]